MEERMTVCNMSIEGGARAGMIAPDDTTFNTCRPPVRSERRGLGRGVARWKQVAHRRRRGLRPIQVTIDADRSSR
jgi:3-isopropylmalate/(R)-2-methylmalate dehydratase large subunit